MLRKLRKIICCFIYYGMARHLPRSYSLGFAGRLSKRLRRLAASPLFKEAGRNINVERRADFGGGGNLIVRDFADIGENARFMGSGTIIIGEHAMMGPDVMIITSDHKILPMGFDGYETANVEIGDYAWIGARAIILKGVKIGKYAIVGAGAVVTADVTDYTIVGGVPAKVIRTRE